MKLKIIEIQEKGNLEEERALLKATEDCNLHFYSICDTTYTSDDKISNELRHLFWLPSMEVEKGDYIRIWTKKGKYNNHKNKSDSTTHNLYWGLGKTVWNEDGDCAVLFEHTDWISKKA